MGGGVANERRGRKYRLATARQENFRFCGGGGAVATTSGASTASASTGGLLPGALSSGRRLVAWARGCPCPVAGRSLRTSCSSLARMPPSLRHPACARRHTPALGAWAAPHGRIGSSGVEPLALCLEAGRASEGSPHGLTRSGPHTLGSRRGLLGQCSRDAYGFAGGWARPAARGQRRLSGHGQPLMAQL
jgi:hypothetical protein